MRTDANAVTGHEFVSLHRDLGALKSWAKRACSKDRIADVGLVTATLVLSGFVGAVLYKVAHSFTVVGF